MTGSITQQFLPVIGSAAEKFGLVSSEAINQAAQLQAKVVLLRQYYPDVDFSKVDDRYLNEHERLVDAKDPRRNVALLRKIEAHEQQLSTPLDPQRIAQEQHKLGNGKPPENVPWFADILQALGHLAKKVTNPMLAAQSAARVKDWINGGDDRLTNVQQVIDESTRYARNDANEPDYVTSAQSLGYMTKMLVAAIRENPALGAEPEVQTALMSAEMLASQSLKQSAKAMDDAGRSDVAKQMRNARDELRQQVYNQTSNPLAGLLSLSLATSVHVDKLQQGLAKAAQQSPHGQVMRQEAAAHLVNVEKIGVFGFKIAGTSKAAPSSWLAKVQAKSPTQNEQGRG